MTKAELLTELRGVLGDTRIPYAWSDARCLRVLTVGQDRFCEKTGFWADKTTYTIITVLNQQDYLIDPRIISVRSIWDSTRQLIDGEGSTFSDTDFADSTPSSPVHYRTDLSTGYITFFEPVIAGIVLQLRVHRKSKVALDAATGQPEVPDEFQLAMIEYAASKLFGDHDRELQDPIKAADHKANFKDYVRDGRRAYLRITNDYSDVVGNPLYVV